MGCDDGWMEILLFIVIDDEGKWFIMRWEKG